MPGPPPRNVMNNKNPEKAENVINRGQPPRTVPYHRVRPALRGHRSSALVKTTACDRTGAWPRRDHISEGSSTDHPWHTVHVLCDLIMPADERSGGHARGCSGVLMTADFRKNEDGDENFGRKISAA